MNKIDRIFWTKNTTESICSDRAYSVIFLISGRYYIYNDNKRRRLFNRTFYKL